MLRLHSAFVVMKNQKMCPCQEFGVRLQGKYPNFGMSDMDKDRPAPSICPQFAFVVSQLIILTCVTMSSLRNDNYSDHKLG